MAEEVTTTDTEDTEESSANKVTANSGVEAINSSMEEKIGSMYDSQLASKKTQLENTYNQNLSDLQADKDKITGEYQTQRNDLASQYEQTRRNNNLQAAANGLNTGAGSQIALAQNNSYLSNSADLNKSEAEANTEADRQITNLKQTYANDILEAQSDNDAQRAAALLDEYSNAYNRTLESAKTLATYGDFSGYSVLYGEETAAQMKENWIAQNPAIAYNMGYIDANRYFSITGTWPAGYGVASSSGSSGGDSGSSGGSSSSGEDYSSNYWINTYNQNASVLGGSTISASESNASSAAAAQAALTDYNNRLAAHYSV